MDFVTPLVNKHCKTFNNSRDVLTWVEQDLRHLGISEESIKEDLIKAKKILGESHGINTV